jgi:hypothetical protein
VERREGLRVLTGGLIPILILLPNLLWMLFPPWGKPEGSVSPTSGLHRLMEILEWVERIAALVIPL